MKGQQERFQSLLQKIADAYPDTEDKETMVQNVTQRFQREYEDPRLEEMTKLLNLKELDKRKYKELVFFPEASGGEYYPRFIQPGSKLQPCCLSLLYLVHKSNWPFLSTFVCFGGLRTLSDLFDHDNHYVRGQVLDIFMHITAGKDEGDKWWEKPKSEDQRRLHEEMLCLAEHRTFFSGLVANSGVEFPGGSAQALQILAFWLSWVRLLYTSNQRLALSEALLIAIKEWGGKKVSKEEQELREKMYEDFRRERPFPSEGTYVVGGQQKELLQVEEFETVSSTNSGAESGNNRTPTPEKDIGEGEVQDVSGNPSENAKEVEPRVAQPTMNFTTPNKSAVDFKTDGNEEFRKGNFEGALDLYTKSLSLLKTEESLETEAIALSTHSPTVLELTEEGDFDLSDPKTTAAEEQKKLDVQNEIASRYKNLSAILHANKAMAYLKLSQAESRQNLQEINADKDAPSKEYVYLGIDEAEKAIEDDPGYLKGHFRYAQLLAQLGKETQAITHLETVRKKIDSFQGKDAASAGQAGLDELLASLLARIGAQSVSCASDLMAPGLSKQEKQAQIMEQLLGRQEFYKSGGKLREITSEDEREEINNPREEDSHRTVSLDLASLLEIDGAEKAVKNSSNQQKSGKQKGKSQRKKEKTMPIKKDKATKTKKRCRQAVEAFRELLITCEQGDAHSIVEKYSGILGLQHEKTKRKILIPEVFGENLTDGIISATVKAYSSVLLQRTNDEDFRTKQIVNTVQVLNAFAQCSRFNFVSLGLSKECQQDIQMLLLVYEDLSIKNRTADRIFSTKQCSIVSDLRSTYHLSRNKDV